MSMFSGSAGYGRAARLGFLGIVLMLFSLVANPAGAQSDTALPGDYGDAPDTTNRSPWPMNAYPWNSGMASVGFSEPPDVLAHYPTVFDPGSSNPQGPWHRFPLGRAWLGQSASIEDHAGYGYDPDIHPTRPSGNVNNIKPAPLNPHTNEREGLAGYDGFDDALPHDVNISLPDCAETGFAYTVSGAAKAGKTVNYLNVWFDGNRDGDFDDNTNICWNPNTQPHAHAVPERAVNNQRIEVNPGSNLFFTPRFYSAHFHVDGYDELIWMRMTLTAAPIDSADGRGSLQGFDYGETEDYLLTNHGDETANRATLNPPPASDDSYHRFVIDVPYWTGGY